MFTNYAEQAFIIFACLSYPQIEPLPIIKLVQRYHQLKLCRLQLHIPIAIFEFHMQLKVFLVDYSKLILEFI